MSRYIINRLLLTIPVLLGVCAASCSMVYVKVSVPKKSGFVGGV